MIILFFLLNVEVAYYGFVVLAAQLFLEFYEFHRNLVFMNLIDFYEYSCSLEGFLGSVCYHLSVVDG